MKRIEVLDLWRSLCVFIMIVFHAIYDLEHMGVIGAGFYDSLPMVLVARITAASFIIISGICTRFSRSAAKRGLFVFGCGIAVSAVSMAVGNPISFGILHFLGISMMICSRLGRYIEKLSVGAVCTFCALLTALSAVAVSRITVGVNWLFPLGFHAPDFYSADYYPLLPWFFVFVAGTALGRVVEEKRENAFFSMRCSPVLTFFGKHSLVVYLLHQPIIYGFFHLIF